MIYLAMRRVLFTTSAISILAIIGVLY